MNMNILLSCDDKYIKYAYVLLESLFSNHSDPMHIYMVYNNAESELYRDLKNFAEGRGDNVMEICDVSHIDIGSLRNSSRFPLECYYTLFPQLYLPESVERILYLDIDTIVDRNLTRFYNSDFEENYLIACGQSQGFKKTDDMPPPKVFGYFNSGVILYNIKKMRQEVSIDKYEYVFSHSDDFFFDQGMLNHLFYKDTKYEETLLYNFRSNIAFGRYFDQAVEMVENREVYIYHYTCKGIPYKPWDLVIEDEIVGVAHEGHRFEHFAREGTISGVVLGKFLPDHHVLKPGQTAVEKILVTGHSALQRTVAQDAGGEHHGV